MPLWTKFVVEVANIPPPTHTQALSVLPSDCTAEVLSLEWLEACLDQGRRVDSKHFILTTDT